MTRKVTNQILDMIYEGVLNEDTVILACLKYMSEDEVADMARINGFIDEGIDEDEDEDFTFAGRFKVTKKEA